MIYDYRFGVYSIDHSINAGLDLEMPGTNKWRTSDLVTRSIGSRKITQRTLKERARKVLELVQRCAKEAPEVTFVFFSAPSSPQGTDIHSSPAN